MSLLILTSGLRATKYQKTGSNQIRRPHRMNSWKTTHSNQKGKRRTIRNGSWRDYWIYKKRCPLVTTRNVELCQNAGGYPSAGPLHQAGPKKNLRPKKRTTPARRKLLRYLIGRYHPIASVRYQQWKTARRHWCARWCQWRQLNRFVRCANYGKITMRGNQGAVPAWVRADAASCRWVARIANVLINNLGHANRCWPKWERLNLVRKPSQVSSTCSGITSPSHPQQRAHKRSDWGHWSKTLALIEVALKLI